MKITQFGDNKVRVDDNGMVSLNDLYKAACAQGLADGKQEPAQWRRDGGAQFIEFVSESLNVGITHIYATKRGRGGGTFAHWQIALAYAKYLSPALHMEVNQVYSRFKAGDVTLADEIADKASPTDQEWLARRVSGKAARGQLTSTLAAHGVQGKGYADCTNAIYRPIMGGKKSEICAQRGLRKSTNLRDVMDLEQLTRTALAEIVANKSIKRINARGNDACANECGRAAEKVAAIQ